MAFEVARFHAIGLLFMGPLEIYRVPRQVKRSGAPETPNFVMHVQAFHLTF